jgi:hypothetical protein
MHPLTTPFSRSILSSFGFKVQLIDYCFSANPSIDYAIHRKVFVVVTWLTRG